MESIYFPFFRFLERIKPRFLNDAAVSTVLSRMVGSACSDGFVHVQLKGVVTAPD